VSGGEPEKQSHRSGSPRTLAAKDAKITSQSARLKDRTVEVSNLKKALRAKERQLAQLTDRHNLVVEDLRERLQRCNAELERARKRAENHRRKLASIARMTKVDE